VAPHAAEDIEQLDVDGAERLQYSRMHQYSSGRPTSSLETMHTTRIRGCTIATLSLSSSEVPHQEARHHHLRHCAAVPRQLRDLPWIPTACIFHY
jgi:hypothetical protein